MSPTTDGGVLTRDWLTGYFHVYPPGPPIVRYSHDAAPIVPCFQQRNVDRALATRDEGGGWNGLYPLGEDHHAR